MNPNFFIVGGSKCGTTNISYYLNLHPKIFFSQLNEPYYFCQWDIPEKFERDSMITDMSRYLDLFRNATTETIVGEASSTYLSCPHAATEIKKAFPKSKILISIRNPIERAHSAYFSYQFMHPTNQSFLEMIKEHEKLINDRVFYIDSILESGFYKKNIMRFQEVFGENNVKIIIFENYIKNIEFEIKSILNFLELDENIHLEEQPKGSYRTPKNSISKILLNNKNFRKLATFLIPTVMRQKLGDKYFLKQVKKPEMLEHERNYLKKFYMDEVTKLEKFLDKRLPWKDFH
ncbi:MAG: sulfotransferase [Candidatus Nitrosopumilus sp. bin_68KS]